MNPTIGVFGGTFDPVHRAHLAVAEEARRQLALDDFRLVPAGDPPHRQATHADACHRLAMLRLALEGHPQLRIDTREMERDGPSWMVDTLASLRAEHPDTSLVLLIGQDAANSFDTWRRWRDIMALSHLVILSRPGMSEQFSEELRAMLLPRMTDDRARLHGQPAGLAHRLNAGDHDLSSTSVRARLLAGEAAQGLLPAGVAEYIERHGLYQGAG